MSRRAWGITAAATAAMTLSYLDRQALRALAPTITAELKLTNTQYGWLGSAFSIAYLLAGPLAARMCDRLGAKRALLIGVLAWSVAAAAHSLAIGFVSFLALRLLLGAVEAPSLPAGAQTVQAVLPPVDRARGRALLCAGMAVGSALAPPIAIGVAGLFGWRASFIALALVALVWIPIWQYATRGGALPRVPAEKSAAWRVVLRDPMMLRGLVGRAAIIPISTFTLQWGAKFFAAQHVGKAAYAAYLIATGAALSASAQSAIILAINPIIGASVDASSTYAPSMLAVAAFAVIPFAGWALWRAKPSPE